MKGQFNFKARVEVSVACYGIDFRLQKDTLLLAAGSFIKELNIFIELWTDWY